MAEVAAVEEEIVETIEVAEAGEVEVTVVMIDPTPITDPEEVEEKLELIMMLQTSLLNLTKPKNDFELS